MPARQDATVTLHDGRRLAFTEWGVPAGPPVFYFHGRLASRIWCPDEVATSAAGVRLIVPDRPGVGRSDPRELMTIGDWPADVLELADALGIARFAVVGVSAGGPYAAACAALIPSRLTCVSLAVSRVVARYNWEERPGIEATWPADHQAEFELTRRDARAGARLAAAHFAPFIAEFAQDPNGFRAELEKAEGDRWFFSDPDRAETFNACTREAWRQGLDAYQWELNAAFMPWGFRLADISIPVRIWHGSQDPWVTDDDIEFQVNTIPQTSLVVWQDSGHLGFVKHWGEIMVALRDDSNATPDGR